VRKVVKYPMGSDTVRPGRTGRILLGAIMIAAMLVASCGVPLTRESSKLQEHRRFFNLLPEEQHIVFQTFPIARQFDVYIVSMTMKEPPDPGFAADIASRRSPAVPFLLKKLRQENYPEYGTSSEKTDEIKEKIIFIFRMMSRYGYHDVKSDKRSMKAIRSAIEGMRNQHPRQLSQEYLDEILSRR
jgi:hypothetical protein